MSVWRNPRHPGKYCQAPGRSHVRTQGGPGLQVSVVGTGGTACRSLLAAFTAAAAGGARNGALPFPACVFLVLPGEVAVFSHEDGLRELSPQVAVAWGAGPQEAGTCLR